MSHHDVMVLTSWPYRWGHTGPRLHKIIPVGRFLPKSNRIDKNWNNLWIHGPAQRLVHEYRVTGTSLVRDMVCI